LSIADWYLALFSIGVGVTLPAYWLLLERVPDRFHLVSEVLTGLVLLAAGISMLAADEGAAWVRVLSAMGLGMRVYALVDSRAQHDMSFPLIQANAEKVPLKDARFDVAISEYGASIWCDPYRWIPEAARLLRPGGELIVLMNGTLLMLTVPDTEAEGAAGDRL